MQKLAKRAAQAQRQASRRARQQMDQENVDGKLRSRIALRSAVQEVRQNLKDARTARKEDWELGPLAPKRDLGFNDYGAFKENVRQDWSNYGLHQPNPKVIEQRCAWAGGVKQLNLAPGDRVVINDGPDKGKIDRIKSVQPQVGTVTLEHRHQVCFLLEESFALLVILMLNIRLCIGCCSRHVWQPQSTTANAHIRRIHPPRLPDDEPRDRSYQRRRYKPAQGSASKHAVLQHVPRPLELRQEVGSPGPRNQPRDTLASG
jgi:hypothetical protein